MARRLLSHVPMLERICRRILVVDDDPGVGQMLTRVLEEAGRYRVTVETDPIVAMATAIVYKPDLLVLDIYMPNLSGLDIARQLRAEPSLSRCPIIFFTGTTMRELPCAGAPGDDPMEFLPKGSSNATIVAMVERMLCATGGCLVTAGA